MRRPNGAAAQGAAILAGYAPAITPLGNWPRLFTVFLDPM
jgi:hypothetical protein